MLQVPAVGSTTLRMRLTDIDPMQKGRTGGLLADFDALMNTRRVEADEFWADVLAGELSDDEPLVARQALAGMLWSKQYYALDVERWLFEQGADPLAAGTGLRNHDWRHLVAEDVISMPDKWEYPWFAAWDLALHTVALAAVDVAFAKQQLEPLLNQRYLHPYGQLPLMNGTSAMSIHRCTRGRHCSSTSSRRRQPARQTAPSSKTRSRN